MTVQTGTTDPFRAARGELAALRLAIGDVAKTRESLRRELEDLRELLQHRPDPRPGTDDGADRRAASSN